MALLLLIETGTNICSIGLAKDGELLAFRESDERDHSNRAARFVDDLLLQTGYKAADLSAVAIGKGPGSYTGLRIGVSLAKGLCYALNIPLIAINSLEAMAVIAKESFAKGACYIPMIDARRMEVYAQVFDNQLNPLTPIGAHIIESNSFEEFRSQGRVLIFGDGAQKAVELLPWAEFIDIKVSVRGMVSLAFAAFEQGNTEEIAYFEPLYLKDFVVKSAKKLF